MRMTHLVFAVAVAVLLAPPCVGVAQQKDGSAMERIRAAFARGEDWPTDADLYAKQISVGHQFDEPQAAPSDLVNKAILQEILAIKHRIPDYRRRIIRSVAGKDSLVVTMRTTGTLPGGAPLRVDAATFFMFESGRVRAIETWEDRKQTDQLRGAMAAAPKE